MSTQPEAGDQQAPIDASQVAEYLRDNPDFFEQHTDLLSELKIPHPVHGSVSLLERQVEVLRDQNRELKRKLMELVQVARDNDRLGERMHRLLLDLIAAGSLQQLLDTLDDHLQGEFNADTVSICLFDLPEEQARESGARTMRRGADELSPFAAFFDSGRPLCGRLKQDQLDYLFGDQAPAVESVALIPVSKGGEHGMLAIGSRSSNHFHPGMGTLFLSHLGELLGAFLKPYLPVPDAG